MLDMTTENDIYGVVGKSSVGHHDANIVVEGGLTYFDAKQIADCANMLPRLLQDRNGKKFACDLFCVTVASAFEVVAQS